MNRLFPFARVGLVSAVLVVTGCADSTRNAGSPFGPPGDTQGMSPGTGGMSGFQPMGNFGPANAPMQPALPPTMSGGFSGN